MTDQEVVFEKNSLTLGFFVKKDIDKNESENILKEAFSMYLNLSKHHS